MLGEVAILTGAASTVIGTVEAIGEQFAGGKIQDHARTIRARLAGRLPLPENHDLVRQIRMAQLTALDRVARSYAALQGKTPHETSEEERSYASVLRGFVDARLKTLSDKSIDFGVLSGDRIQDVLDFMVHPSPDATLADLQTLARNRAEAAIISEIEADAGRIMPSRLRHLIESTGSEGWYDFFSGEVDEQLKTNERFKSVFLFAELADIKQEIKTVGAKVDSVSDETVTKLMAALDEREKAAAREAGVRDKKIVAIASRVAEEFIDDPDLALTVLDSYLKKAIRESEAASRGSNAGPIADETLARIRETSNSGDFKAAHAIADAAFARMEADEFDRQATAQQAMLAVVREGLLQAEYDFDTPAVATSLARIVALEHPANRAAQRAALRAHWGTNYEEGRIRGNLFALRVAAAIAGRLLETSETPEEKSDCYNLLGNALCTLGERAGGEDGIGALNHAVDAYEDALKVSTRAEMPTDWAMTKSNLGSTLSIIGVRAGGADGIDALNRAVAAYEDALQVCTRAEMPAQWAGTKNNLGSTLSIIGERTGGADGINDLNNAVAAFGDALQVRSRAKMPTDWAATKNNLGNALRALGERVDGVDGINYLNRAVSACADALQVRTRAKMPADWAATKNNLGTVLSTIGERTGGADGINDLNNAVAAFGDALQVHTRAKMPVDWAATKNNLGNTLRTLGERVGGADGIGALKNAVAACGDALQVRTRADMPADWAVTKNNLGNALRTLGVRVGGADGIDALKDAIAAYQDALTVFTMESAAHYAEVIGGNLERARAVLARLQGGDE